MPTNNLAPKAKNKLGYASSIPPNMAERFGAAVSPYLQGAQALFPPANPYGQVVSNFLLGQAPQAAQQMAAGYPNVLFNTSNPLGGNRIVNPVALDMALALPVATAVKGAGMAGGGVAATFAGARAKTANRAALALAEEMKALGTPDEEIYRATGWFFGSADGRPRFEIPDDQARLINPAPNRLGNAYDHEELYNAYPDTQGLHYSANIDPMLFSPSGSFTNDKIKVKASGIRPAESTTLHELQHAIQQREGFARGGSPADFAGDKANKALQELSARQTQGLKPFSEEAQAIRNRLFDSLEKDDAIGYPQKLYRRLAGEAEARLTQSRMDMTGPERAASYPPSMFDVPVGDQIVRYGEGPALATVYHGSPHRFEPTELNDLGEFNAAKIGTGEGAQAYGHGLYLAEARATGEGYRDQLAKTQIEPGDYAEYFAPNSVRPSYGGHDKILDFDPESGIVTAQSVVKNKNDEWVPEPNSQVRRHKTMPNVAELEKTLGRKPGHLYKVDLPDEHIAKMLDWDKPLSQQTPNVQKALSPLLDAIELDKRSLMTAFSKPDLDREMIAWRKGLTGEDVLQTVEQYIGQKSGTAGRYEQEASKALSDLGIPGVRYLDAGSRGAGGGTSNFVVFPGNENMMTILERNGQRRMTEGELRHQTAQRNAALPVEQGGLGLAAGNTAAERAAAQGGKDSYHFTNEVFDNFDPLKIGSATDEGWLGHGFYSTTDKSVNAPSANGLSGWGKRVSMPLTILDEQLNKQVPYENWKLGKQEAMRKSTGYPENATAKEISNALSLEGKTGLTLDYSPVGYNHQEIMTIDPSNIRSRFAAFDPFRRNAAIAAAMGVAAPNLLAGEQQSPESQAIARYREVKGPKSVVRMEAALRTAGVPLPKNEPVAYIRRLVDQAHRRN